jgi:23S rRNA pseudouridine2605 synthase
MEEENKVRLQKYMSQAWICSRRKAEEYIAAGDVFINWVKATIWQSVDPSKDKVTIWNKLVEDNKKHVYYKLNKPYGIVTTCKQDGETWILDIVDIGERVFPVWRLDKNSTGLILLTNDWRLSNYLMHPRYEHEKEYVVQTFWKIEDEDLITMSEWVFILWKKTRNTEITRLNSWMFSIILREWMNRQIRRMVESVGHKVKKLIRVRIENIKLDNLKEWEFKKLTSKELSELSKKMGITIQ